MKQAEVIEDAALDEITIGSPAHPSFDDSIVGIDGPLEVMPAVNLLIFLGRQRSLPKFASGVMHQSGFAINDTAFYYPTDGLEFGEGPYPGVLIHDPLDQIYAHPLAFERLAARFFRAVIDAATRQHDPMLRQEWWPEFVATVGQIEQRVASQA